MRELRRQKAVGLGLGLGGSYGDRKRWGCFSVHLYWCTGV